MSNKERLGKEVSEMGRIKEKENKLDWRCALDILRTNVALAGKVGDRKSSFQEKAEQERTVVFDEIIQSLFCLRVNMTDLIYEELTEIMNVFQDGRKFILDEAKFCTGKPGLIDVDFAGLILKFEENLMTFLPRKATGNKSFSIKEWSGNA